MKEADIRPVHLFKEYLRLSAQDAIAYFQPENREKITCPACNSPQAELGFNKHEFDYLVCQDCNTLYASPRPPLWEYEAFYRDSPSSNYFADIFIPAVIEKRRSRMFIPRVESIRKLCADNAFQPQAIVDVGAGNGIFLEEWKKRHPESRVCAIEPSVAFARTCRDKGIEVLETIVENADAWSEKADLITSFELIEHTHNPLVFIQSLYKILKPGGYIVLSGLGVEGFDIQVLWENSKSVSPPHHINFMSVRGFEILFERGGFSNIQVLTPGKLDVDILLNSLAENPNVEIGRFEKLLLERGEEALHAFQTFLATYQLSSHCQVWAQKPKQ